MEKAVIVGGGGNGNSSGHRDYGATSSSLSSNIGGRPNAVPDVGFAGFSPTEFMSLSENIAQCIGSVKSSWWSLSKAIKVLGTRMDNKVMREKIHQIQATANQKILFTSKDLQRLTVVVRHGDKKQKLQVEKLTSDFKLIVEKYSSSQQLIATKMKATLIMNASQVDDQNVSQNSDQEHLVQQQKTIALQYDQDLLVEREQRVQQIEADVLDVNQIMRELSSLITQQGDDIDTIANGITHTASNIESGTEELQKAAQSQAKYRRKFLILLLVAVIIGIFVTALLISELKR